MGKDNMLDQLKDAGRALSRAERAVLKGRWDRTSIILSSLAAGVTGLGIYKLRNQKSRDELINEWGKFVEFTNRMKTTGSDPSSLFHELPQGSKLTRTLALVSQTIGTMRYCPFISPPLVGAREWAIGSLYYQEVVFEFTRPEAQKLRRRSFSAIVGLENSLSEINLWEKQPEVRVRDIIMQYSVMQT